MLAQTKSYLLDNTQLAGQFPVTICITLSSLCIAARVMQQVWMIANLQQRAQSSKRVRLAGKHLRNDV